MGNNIGLFKIINIMKYDINTIIMITLGLGYRLYTGLNARYFFELHSNLTKPANKTTLKLTLKQYLTSIYNIFLLVRLHLYVSDLSDSAIL